MVPNSVRVTVRLAILSIVAAFCVFAFRGASAQTVSYCTPAQVGAGFNLVCTNAAPQVNGRYACTRTDSADGFRYDCVPFTPPTATPLPTATPTLLPTATPLPTATAVPPTPVPPGSVVEPNWLDTNITGETGMSQANYQQIVRDAASGLFDRACNDNEHNATQWHTLLNYQAMCHYDHQHGDNPNAVNDIFGVPGVWFGSAGWSVAYPWQTFPIADNETNPNVARPANVLLENESKHEGFQWIVRRNQTCNGGRYCVKAFRLQYHFHGHHDAPVRWHSYSIEAQLCVNPSDASTCGLYKLGGWADYARFYAPPQAQGQNTDCWITYNQYLNGTPSAQTFGQYVGNLANYNQFYRPERDQLPNDELRCHKQIPSSVIAASPRGIPNAAEWWGHSPFDFRFQIRVYNPAGTASLTADKTGVIVGEPFCAATDAACRWTHSRVTAELDYVVPINRGLDFNGDGVADFNTWVGRLGQQVSGCTTAGLNCVPADMRGVRINPNALGYNHDLTANSVALDYDITPSGRPSWITWFRMH